ncbi:MAG: hypothetical protein AAF564_19285 [Bacteroidota bacterium]
MKRSYIKICQWTCAFVAVLLFAGTTASFAQTYTLTIRNGEVYVNGKMLERDEIPASLDAETIEATLSFPQPNFEFNGHYYKIENDQLLDVTPEGRVDNRTQVIFRSNAPAADAEYSESYGAQRARKSSGYAFSTRQGDPNVVMQQYVIELKQNASELNAMRETLPQSKAHDLIQQVQIQAEQAAQLAQDLPYLEMQRYFATVRAEDELLYQRLVTELELERETQRLAAQVRQMPSSESRSSKVEELREMLGSILELKQENRRLEIEQLEEQLAVLKQRFSEREAMKDRMIERRLKELVGSTQ